NAVDFFPAPPKREVPLNPTLVYAGRLVAWKGVSMLIKAVGELKKNRQNIIFEILGDGPEEAKLKESVNNLELTGNVIFRGRVSEEDVRRARSAGFNDAELVEIVAHVALNTLTNYLNEVFDTEVDFPKLDAARAA
ncbi:MAG: glycosyltransferase, partial [Alphaproteobacteria bacterium]|nr:glycosyltransferase [Alphaproteobacteria bacterium]